MKSCLKGASLPGSPDPNHLFRKCVAFNAEGSEEVHWADEWDRTPTEPATKLSYQLRLVYLLYPYRDLACLTDCFSIFYTGKS
jgi:hypothetical protein